jgi:sulfopyruvate decarboxylase TPP-binding subunit
MFSGEELVAELRVMGVTHVVWLPDSTLGAWDGALESAADIVLIRVSREAEAWAIAAGLYLGGQTPLVVMQCTGLFDSGDSLRNFLFDYELPLFALIGHRSSLNPTANDSARTYTEPILTAWGLDYVSVQEVGDLPLVREHWNRCRQAKRPGIVLIGEGRL